VPGNSQSIWKAVKTGKDINVTSLPSTVFKENMKIKEKMLPDSFANYFDNKIIKLLVKIQIDDNVYYGSNK
jgi:hypothetical protein